MKYEALRKPKRDALLVKYHQDNPGLSFKEVGAIFGITKQRVGQILSRRDGDEPRPSTKVPSRNSPGKHEGATTLSDSTHPMA